MRIEAIFSQGVPQARVRLNVDGRDWIARLQRVDGDEMGFRSWVGDIEGIPYSHVVFTERDGTVSGLINAVSSTYRIRTAEAGTYLLERMAADSSRRDSEPLVGTPRAEAALLDRLEAPADTASTIDVLMLYTPNARAQAGGVSQIQAMASQVISDSNTIFGRSNVTTRLRLAGTAEFALTEASSMASDLNQLTDSTTSHAMRDTYRADLVQLLESSPDVTVCGLGWLLTSLSSTNFDAYSVVDVDCVPQYSPTHEMGHNMGSHHAPEDGASGALFTYSYGYKDPAHGFRTVMASSCTNGTCPRIANFSNPGIFNNGYVTGTNNQNNSLSINNAALTVANWRQSAASGGSGGGTGGGSSTGGSTGVWTTSITALVNTVTATWPVPPNGFVPTGYQVEIVNSASNSTVAIVNVGTSMFYSTTLANGSYVLRVRALGSAGVGATTTDASFTIGPPVANIAPLAPRDLRFDLTGGRVTLSWNVSAATAPWSSFIVDVGTASSLSNLGSYDTGSPLRQLVAPQPLPGVYFVRVRARNSFGVSDPSNEVLVYIPGQVSSACSGPPVPPVGLNSTVVGSFVTLSWTYGVGPQPVSGYRLDVGSAPGLSNLLQYPIGPATVFSGNASSGAYFARVLAVNACGVSGPSNEVAVTIP